MRLENKVALITGAASGIGRSTALAYAREGARVVVNYARSEDEARATVAAVEAAGGVALLAQADVANEAQVAAMVGRVTDQWGGVDILVNNAGTTVFADLANLAAIDDAAWDRLFAVNVKGAWYCARACEPSLQARGGTIINVASIAGFTGVGSSIPYSVTKGAVITLTKSLAKALAPRVRVNAIAPGFVDTRWHASRPGAAQTIADRVPLKRVAGPDDIADLALYLAGASVVTGQVFVIDAGASM